MTKAQDKAAQETVVEEESKPNLRLRAKDVVIHALEVLNEHPEGMTLTDLAKALEDKGIKNPEGKTMTYRQMHNVTWWLEGRPATGSKVKDHQEPMLAERVAPRSKTYKITQEGIAQLQG